MTPPIALEFEGVSDTQGIVLPNPLTINDISNRRVAAGKLVAGTAAFTSSDHFKKPVCVYEQSQIMLTVTVHRQTQGETMGSLSKSRELLTKAILFESRRKIFEGTWYDIAWWRPTLSGILPHRVA